MSASDFTRRSSYGPTSPAVGERGARTRQRIVDVTLTLFEERGFYLTLVDDIATEVGISRATLYQYFESKEDIFIELLRECGAALLRVIPRLGPTGPTAAGFDNLHWWLGEWAWVYDKYSTMFVQWSHVDSPKAPLRPLISDFIGEYGRRMTRRLADSDLDGIDPTDFAIALLSTVNRVNYYRCTGAARGLSDDRLLDALATTFQLVLYPSTPAEALVHTGPDAGVGRTSRPLRPRPALPPAVGAEDEERAIGAGGYEARAEGLSPRVRATVRRLLDAGGEVYGANGYHQASVDDIVREAGLGRGTFYKYFDDKLDLLTVLANDCVAALGDLSETFEQIGQGRGAPAALRAWLTDFVAVHRRYMGVFRVWIEGEPGAPGLQRLGRVATSRLVRTFDTALGSLERRYPFDVTASSLILLSLLERMPSEVLGTRYELSEDRLVETMAVVIERGLLNRGRRRGVRPRLAG